MVNLLTADYVDSTDPAQHKLAGIQIALIYHNLQSKEEMSPGEFYMVQTMTDIFIYSEFKVFECPQNPTRPATDRFMA